MGFLRIFAYKVFQYKQKFNMRNLEFITKACGIIRTGDAVCFNKASIAAAVALFGELLSHNGANNYVKSH